MARQILRPRIGMHILLTAAAIATLGFAASGPLGAAEPSTASTISSSATLATAVDEIMEAALEEPHTAGFSVAVVQGDEIVFAKGYGFADLEHHVTATPETVYRIGSITKQFTAVAALMLVEDGKLSLDDTLDEFLPDFDTQGHTVTVAHLLNHTSGIKSYTNSLKFFAIKKHIASLDKVLEVVADEPFNFPPGEGWKYNNTGYFMLGMVIEKVADQPYEDFLRDRIFDPLEMSSTCYGDPRKIVPHRARGYNDRRGERVNCESIDMRTPFAAGALLSTVLDLAKWHLALQRGELLSAASYAAMYTPTKLKDGTEHPYGYGWMVGEHDGHRRIAHGGGIDGFRTHITRFPDDEACVIVLANHQLGGTEPYALRIADIVFAAQDSAE